MVRVRYALAYELGGAIRDFDKAKQRLQDAFTEVSIETLAFRSFNLSYASFHDPTIGITFKPTRFEFGGKPRTASREALLFPWLGVVIVSVEFELDSDDDPAETYDAFQSWKNEDYLPYLDRCGAMSEQLRRHTDYTNATRAEIGPVAEVVESMLILLKDLVEARPKRYAFQDLRTTVIADRKEMSEESLAHLLALTSVTRSRPMRPNGTVRPGEVASRRAATSDLEVVSNGWVTVVIQNPESTADGLTSVLNAQCLAHAQWFVCQSWIYILSTTIADGRVAGASVPLHELARYRQNFELDLIESGNLDLMLKDPVLRQVARMFQDAMEVSQHRTTARDRFDVVLRAEQERLGYQSARDSERLQLLFSISAAAAVAALIPSLAAVQWDAIVMVVTVAILCLLLLAFVVNVAVLGRRLSRSRRSRTPTKSRIATSDSMGG